jgi:hypothetical protein
LLDLYLLITYERALFGQAKTRKFLILTNERKKMSTKTTFKRIALVAVAAMSTGVLTSVAPASAANDAGFTTTSLNITRYTSPAVAGSAVEFNLGGVFATNAGIDDTESTDFTGALTSFPAGGYVGVTAQAETAAGAAVAVMGDDFAAADVAAAGAVLTRTSSADNFVGGTVTSSSTVGIGSFSFTPQVAGDYVLTIWNDNDQDGSIDLTEARQTISVTVAAAADLSPAGSVKWMTGTAAGQAAAASATTNAIPRSGVKTAGTYIAQIVVDLQTTTPADDDRAHTVSASVSGAGYVTVNTTADTDPGSTSRVSTNSTAQSERYVHIEADGTSGTGTVTVSVTHAVTGVTTVLGSWSYSFYGDVTKLAVDTTNYTIGRAGYTTGAPDANLGTRTEAGEAEGPLSADSTVPAFIIKATDANGNAATADAAPTVVSSDSTVITGGTCAIDTGAATYGSSSNGVGFYNCNFDTAAGATSGKKATLTFRITDPADATKYLTTTADVTVGGAIANSTLTLDKSSYAPGEGMTVTRSATDASGNPVYDGATVGAVTFSKAIGGTAPAADYFVGGKVSSDSSTGAKTVFAPVMGGDFTAQLTGKKAEVTANIVATATVSDEAASAATDAANEATDAANAATDAALAAADAADAATAAAQDASDAVAALSASVSKMISSLKAQITSLTNLVIKIQKKVRA